MRPFAILVLAPFLTAGVCVAAAPPRQPSVIARPEAFETLVNPACSHCRDEAKRRAVELKPDDRVLAWIRGYSDGGAIPFRFFLNPYRVISDSYGVFVHDPDATVYSEEKPAAPPTKAEADKKVKEVAGTSEFLRLLPKPFGVVKGVDPKARTVTLLADGETEAKTWPLEPDAEVKVGGWWGRLEQFKPGDRAWAWLKLDRKKKPVSVVMLADDLTEFDMHGGLRPKKDGKPRFALDKVEAKRKEQRAWLRKRWADEGLPGTLTFHHVFSGELELALDHEAMRWGRSLAAGDAVRLAADPPIKAVVKAVSPWRERTVVRLVVGELESSELKVGQRLALKMTPPKAAVEDSEYPPDIGRPRSRAERIEWFLASTYCTCGVSKDVCTGHFYTLASCNPNGCGMPNSRRKAVGAMIDRGMTDRQIFDRLLKEAGPPMLRPHLMP